MTFLGCFLGCLCAEFLYKYFTSKIDRIMFEYKAENEIKKRWLE